MASGAQDDDFSRMTSQPAEWFNTFTTSITSTVNGIVTPPATSPAGNPAPQAFPNGAAQNQTAPVPSTEISSTLAPEAQPDGVQSTRGVSFKDIDTPAQSGDAEEAVEDLPPPPPSKPAVKYRPSPNAHEWPEKEEVERWTPVQVAEWVTLMGYEKYASLFVSHKITGKLLVQLKDYQLAHMGLGVLGARVKLMENIQQLNRIYSKPETAKLQEPSLPERFLSLFLFSWAETSEGKTGEQGKEEIMAAMSTIAMVATLVLGTGWSIFLSSHKDCYCDMKNPSSCWCSVAFDIQQEESASVFYATSAIATMCFLFTTLFSVLQMIMISECSDESELAKFNGTGQSPGIIFGVGLFFLVIPIHIYVILTRQFGTYWTAQTTFEDVQIKVFSIILLASIFIMFNYCFLYVLPNWVSYVYKAKVISAKRDRITSAEKKLEEKLGIAP